MIAIFVNILCWTGVEKVGVEWVGFARRVGAEPIFIFGMKELQLFKTNWKKTSGHWGIAKIASKRLRLRISTDWRLLLLYTFFFCVIRSENCNCMKIKRLLFVIRLIFFQNERIQFSLKVFEYYYFSIRSPMTISEFQKLLFRMKRKHSKYKIN